MGPPRQGLDLAGEGARPIHHRLIGQVQLAVLDGQPKGLADIMDRRDRSLARAQGRQGVVQQTLQPLQGSGRQHASARGGLDRACGFGHRPGPEAQAHGLQGVGRAGHRFRVVGRPRGGELSETVGRVLRVQGLDAGDEIGLAGRGHPGQILANGRVEQAVGRGRLGPGRRIARGG